MKLTCVILWLSGVSSFTATLPKTATNPRRSLVVFLQSTQQKENPFSAFADSLEEQFDDTNGSSTWQAKIDSLLDPSTPLASRQLLLSELLAANQEIRDSVQAALTTGKVNGLPSIYTIIYIYSIVFRLKHIFEMQTKLLTQSIPNRLMVS